MAFIPPERARLRIEPKALTASNTVVTPCFWMLVQARVGIGLAIYGGTRMTYKPLLIALAASGRQSRDLDEFIPARAGGLIAGWHDVSIVSVDMSRLASHGSIKLVLESDDGIHTENLWLVERDRPALSWKFTNFLNALCLRPEIYDSFQEAIRALGDTALNLFRGMRVRVQLVPGPGYRMHLTPTRQYAIVDATTGGQVVAGTFSSESEARRVADARGLKRSFNRVAKYESVSDIVADANWAAFQSARAGLGRAIESGVRIETGASGSTVAASAASHPEPANTSRTASNPAGPVGPVGG